MTYPNKFANVSEYGRAITPRSGDRLIAVLYAYFDASKSNGRGITTVAGYLGTLKEFEQLEAEWKAALTYWELPTFHRTEIIQQFGHTKGNLCIQYFANILRKSDLIGMGVAALDIGWVPTNTKVNQELYFHPDRYVHCLQWVLKSICEKSEKEFSGSGVAIFCDRDAGSQYICEHFEAVREHYPILESITVGSMIKMVPLQFADLAAGWFRIELLEQYKKGWGRGAAVMLNDIAKRAPAKFDKFDMELFSCLKPHEAARLYSLGPTFYITYTVTF